MSYAIPKEEEDNEGEIFYGTGYEYYCSLKVHCDGSVLSPGALTLWRYNHGCITTAIHNFRHTLLQLKKGDYIRGVENRF